MKNLLIIGLLFISSWSLSQNYSISGTLTDSSTGETLLGASIFAKETGKGTITNEYGFFSLSLPKGKHTIIISYLGFNEVTQELELTSNKQLQIELKPSDNELDEVV